MDYQQILDADLHLREMYVWVRFMYIEPAEKTLKDLRYQYAWEVAAKNGITSGMTFKLPLVIFWSGDYSKAEAFIPEPNHYVAARVLDVAFSGNEDIKIHIQYKIPSPEHYREESFPLRHFLQILNAVKGDDE